MYYNTASANHSPPEKKKSKKDPSHPRFVMKFWYFMHQLPKINSRGGHELSNNSMEEVIFPDVIRQSLHSHRSLLKLRSSGRFALWWTGVSGRSHDIRLLWLSRNMAQLIPEQKVTGGWSNLSHSLLLSLNKKQCQLSSGAW